MPPALVGDRSGTDAVVVREIADFLSGQPPFDALDDDDLTR